MRRFQNLLILLILATLSMTPRLLAGFSDLRRAQTALSASDYASATDAFRAAALRLPWRADLWELSGKAAYQAEDLARARDFFQRAPALSQTNRFLLGEVYWQSDEFDQALTVWEALSAEGFESVELSTRLAQAYLRNGEEAKELTALQALVRLDPNNAGALYRLGLLLMARGEASALTYLTRALPLDPGRGVIIQTLRTALNTAFLSENRAYQLVVVGRALGDIGEWKLATTAFARAVQADQMYAEAWAWLGEALQQQGREGGEVLAYAYQLNPKSPMVAVLYALYHQRQEHSVEAFKLLQQAVDLEPQNPAWWAALASAQAQSGDVTGALDTYQKAVDRAPNDPAYWRLLAAFTANYDYLVEAVGVHAALMAYSLDEKDPANSEMMGFVMLKRQQYAAAEFYLLRALTLDGQRPAAHFYMGLLSLQQNDLVRARAFLEKARDLDMTGPIGAQAQRILARYFP